MKRKNSGRRNLRRASDPRPVTNSFPNQVMTPREASQYLGFHIVSLYRLIRSQKIPAMKIGGRWRFSKVVLDTWMFNQMTLGQHQVP
jgi:excisionase family DNA binding protein